MQRRSRPGYDPDPRPVDGDDIRAAAAFAALLEDAVAADWAGAGSAQAGDGTLVRFVVDEIFYGRNPTTARSTR